MFPKTCLQMLSVYSWSLSLLSFHFLCITSVYVNPREGVGFLEEGDEAWDGLDIVSGVPPLQGQLIALGGSLTLGWRMEMHTPPVS